MRTLSEQIAFNVIGKNLLHQFDALISWKTKLMQEINYLRRKFVLTSFCFFNRNSPSNFPEPELISQFAIFLFRIFR